MFKAQIHQCERQTGSNPIGPYLQTKVIHILSMQTLQIHDLHPFSACVRRN